MEEQQHKTITEETAKRLVSILSKEPTGAALKSVELAKKPIVTIRNNQIIAGVTASVGLVIFALGVENVITKIPAMSSPLVEISIGLVLLSISGLLLKKLN